MPLKNSVYCFWKHQHTHFDLAKSNHICLRLRKIDSDRLFFQLYISRNTVDKYLSTLITILDRRKDLFIKVQNQIKIK